MFSQKTCVYKPFNEWTTLNWYNLSTRELCMVYTLPTQQHIPFPSQQQHCQIACQIKCQNITVKNWIINICAYTGWKMTQNDGSCECIIWIGGDSFFLLVACRLQCDWYMEWNTIEYLLQKSKYGLNNLNTFYCSSVEGPISQPVLRNQNDIKLIFHTLSSVVIECSVDSILYICVVCAIFFFVVIQNDVDTFE